MQVILNRDLWDLRDFSEVKRNKNPASPLNSINPGANLHPGL
jgi:hypothetical protein